MNFNELKQIILQIQKTIPCKDCGRAFPDSNVHIIGTVMNEGFLAAHCDHCKNKTLLSVFFKANRVSKKGDPKLIHDIRTIHPDEVLDMHNFLKDFDGDFSRLFSQSSS